MKKYFAMVDKAGDSRYWYADKIGQEFPVLRLGKTELLVQTHDSYNTTNFIQVDDLTLSVKEVKE